MNCAGPRSYPQAHRRALSLRRVHIIDSHWILPLSPLTVATFIQVPSVILLLSLDWQLVTAGQAKNTLLLCYNHSAMRGSSCTHFWRRQNIKIIPLVCYRHCADVSKCRTIATLFVSKNTKCLHHGLLYVTLQKYINEVCWLVHCVWYERSWFNCDARHFGLNFSRYSIFGWMDEWMDGLYLQPSN